MNNYNQIEDRIISNIAAFAMTGISESYLKSEKGEMTVILNDSSGDKEVITEDTP